MRFWPMTASPTTAISATASSDIFQECDAGVLPEHQLDIWLLFTQDIPLRIARWQAHDEHIVLASESTFLFFSVEVG